MLVMADNGGLESLELDQDDFDDDPFENIPTATLRALEESAILASQYPTPFAIGPNIGHDQHNQNYHAPEEVVNLNDFALADRSSSGPPQPFINPQPSSQSVNQQAALKRLKIENAALKNTANEATSQAQTKAGEIAILRKRLESSTRDYEQRLDVLRKSHRESQIKAKDELELIKKEREKIEIDKKFLEHDVVYGVSKGRVQAKSTLQPPNKQSILKQHNLPFGDGFGQDSAPFVSPPKNRAHVSFDSVAAPSVPSTPTNRQEKKRKRVQNSSQHPPDIPLPLVVPYAAPSPPPAPSPWQSFSPFVPSDDFGDTNTTKSAVIKPLATDSFLQRLLNFRIQPSGDRFLELLAKHSLPSNPGSSLSNVLLDSIFKLPSTSNETESDTTLKFVVSIGEVWNSCLEQEYHNVTDVFTNAILRVFGSKPYKFIRETILYILPPAMKTVDLVAYPISAKAYNESQGIIDDTKPPVGLDIETCFELIHIMAMACRSSPEHVNMFWRFINIHWVLCLLMEAQPVGQVIFVCNLLRNSAQTDTIGPIWKPEDVGTAADQASVESLLIERLTSLLSQLPATAEKQSWNTLDLLNFRLTVLFTLQSMAYFPRSGESLVLHSMAIVRIVKFLYDVIDLLYSPTTYADDTHELAITCVNTTMRFLYYLLTQHAGKFDVREKLKMIRGGPHLFLIALTRLAFCESIVLEKGIEPAVSDAAHALLDEFLSPVEGEQLLKMFPSADSTGTFSKLRLDSMEIDNDAGTEPPSDEELGEKDEEGEEEEEEAEAEAEAEGRADKSFIGGEQLGRNVALEADTLGMKYNPMEID